MTRYFPFKYLSPKYRAMLFLWPIVMVLISTPARADHPTAAFGSEVSGSINTISGEPLARGQRVIGLRTEIINSDAFSDEALESLAASGIEGVHSIDRLSSTSLVLAYGISDDLTVGLRLPYLRRNNIREGEMEGGVPEVHSKGDAAGLGDTVFFGQYRFFKQDSMDASILFGVKAPTGKTDVNNQGARLDAELQPGSGSWDAFAGAAVSRRRGRVGYHANVLFNQTTKGSQDADSGDAFFYNAAFSYRLTRGDHLHQASAEHNHFIWDLLLELNGETRGKNKVAGEPQPHSGGSLLYLSPGFRLSFGAGWTAFLSYGIPVSQDPNGAQAKVDDRLIGGVSFGF